MDTDIRAIMFDLGNVTVSFNHNLAVNRIKNFTDKNYDEIYQLFFDSNLTGLFEEGKISPYEFYFKVCKLLKLKITYEEFLPIWNEIFFLTSDNLEIHSLIKNFQQKLILVLISNINKLHYEYLKSQYDIFTHFDRYVLSYEIGVRKPNPLIYRQALSSAGVRNCEAIYIDDRKDLIDKSADLGIKSICFKTYAGLYESLIKLIPINMQSIS